MNLRRAIKHSCDLYFYEAAKRTGIDRIEAMAKRFGLGKVTELGIPGEKEGIVPGRNWKMAFNGEPWQQGETLIAGIGQGFLLATPIQLAVMVSRLANGGRAVQPRLIRSVGDEIIEPLQAPDMALNRQHLDIIHKGMNAVSNEPGGTAFGSGIREKSIFVFL